MRGVRCSDRMRPLVLACATDKDYLYGGNTLRRFNPSALTDWHVLYSSKGKFCTYDEMQIQGIAHDVFKDGVSNRIDLRRRLRKSIAVFVFTALIYPVGYAQEHSSFEHFIQAVNNTPIAKRSSLVTQISCESWSNTDHRRQRKSTFRLVWESGHVKSRG